MKRLIRRSHRWIAVAFTLSVAANFIAMAGGPPPAWITYAPLLPLGLLMLSGTFLFFSAGEARDAGARSACNQASTVRSGATGP